MDDLSVSIFGRAVLRLARAEATGRVAIHGARTTAHLFLSGGTPVALTGPASTPTLGELVGIADAPLRADGSLFGQALIRAGRATPAAVSAALRRQMRARLAAALREPDISFAFVRGERARRPLAEPMSAVDLLLAAIRATRSHDMLDRRGAWRLTPSADVLTTASLAPAEAALLGALKQRAFDANTLMAIGGGVSALRTLESWRCLGFVEEADRGSGRHTLLLQTRQALRRADAPRRVLGLPARATARDARRAVRRLARGVHPDLFPSSLQEASASVLRGLLDAEAALQRR